LKRALSIRQPLSELILRGEKVLEYRNMTLYIGAHDSAVSRFAPLRIDVSGVVEMTTPVNLRNLLQPVVTAAEAAGLQDRFWPMHDLIFDNQQFLEDEHLFRYAGLIGCDLDQFAQDIDSEEVAEKVRSDFLSGARSGVNGTPTFFINGVRHDGPWDMQSLLTSIADAV